MNSLLKLFRILSCAAILAPGLAVAQISMGGNDVLGLVGTARTLEVDTTGSVTVNVGSPGANQTWDFSAVSLQGLKVTQSFSTESGTPFVSSFPSANFVSIITGIMAQQGMEFVFYGYFEVTSSEFASLGEGVTIPSLDSSFVSSRSKDVVPLPLTFNTTWASTSTDTTGDPATFAFVTVDTSTNTVDAWGKMTLPIGTFDCLRVRSDTKTTSTNIVGGTPMPPTTSQNIEYTWISKDKFILADVESQDGETNPNFTNASGVQVLFSLTTGVEDEGARIPENFSLSQNYPNPFNPETVISYEIPERGRVELTVYNLRGRKIRTLVSETREAGVYQAAWNGTDELGKRVASGLYLYRLKTGELATARRMLLLQ